jgi:predicted transcriptional regulator
VSTDTEYGKRPWRDESLLRVLYHEQDMTQEEIAAELGCGGGTVNRWVHNHDLEVSDIGSTNTQIRDVDLHELYWDEGMSQKEIAAMCDCSVALVSKKMTEQDVPTKSSTNGMPLCYTRKQGGHEYITTGGCGDDVQLHRLLAVAEYGYEPVKDNHVHHINGIPWDNRPANIDVVAPGEHTTIHNKQRDWERVERDEKGRLVSFN